MTHPPHMPPKSSSLQQRRAVQTLPWLFVFMALSAVIATSISTAFLAWYVPDFVSYYVPAVISNRQSVSNDSGIDPLLAKHIDDRSVTLYRAPAASVGALAATNRVGQGILLSSDGWIALLIDGTLPAGTIALDTEGKTHSIETTIVDEESGIIYAKLSAGNFLVSTLSSWQQDMYRASVWVLNEWGIERQLVSERAILQSPAQLELHTPYTALNLSADTGSIVYDESGAFVGFVQDTTIVPSWYVSNALSAILAGTPIETTRTGYRGVLVEAYTDPLNGVYIDSPAVQITTVPLTTNTTDDTALRVGDIITAIDTKPVHMHTLAREWAAPKTITLRILRDGEYRTIELAS